MQKVFVAPVKIAIEADSVDEAADLIRDILNEYVGNGILDWKYESAVMNTDVKSGIYLMTPDDYAVGKVFK